MDKSSFWLLRAYIKKENFEQNHFFSVSIVLTNFSNLKAIFSPQQFISMNFGVKVKTFSRSTNEAVQEERDSQVVRQLNFPLNTNRASFKYKNEVTFEKNLNNNQVWREIKIVNELCSQKGNMLQKLTSIKFGDQIITIKDQYHIEATELKIDDGSSKKRVRIFKKSLAQKEEGDSVKRMTNNLPKNFIKAFMNYLSDIEDSQNRQIVQSRIRQLRRKQKFNNNLIQQIVNDSLIRDYFEDFLQNYAQSWINNSKIKNKKMHYQARKVFFRLLKTTQNALNIQSNTIPTRFDSQEAKSSNQNQNEGKDFSLGQQISRQNQKDSILANKSQGQGVEEMENIFQQGQQKYNFDI